MIVHGTSKDQLNRCSRKFFCYSSTLFRDGVRNFHPISDLVLSNG